MKPRLAITLLGIVFLLSMLSFTESPGGEKPEKAAPKTTQAWSLEEALEALKQNPRDPFLQYVSFQLARREKDSEKAIAEVEGILAHLTQGSGDEEVRGKQVDLFNIFTGALAVQESLQLDALRGNAKRRNERKVTTEVKEVTETAYKDVEYTIKKDGKDVKCIKKVPYTVMKVVPVKVANEVSEEDVIREKRRKELVDVATLPGPDVNSHPWKKMLAGKKPELSPLAQFVPSDCYFVESRSLGKLLEAMELADQWGTHLVNQAVREARTQRVGERLQQQLALESHPEMRPFYDLAVEEVAIAGNDLYLREGSDVTLLFRLKQPGIFKNRADAFLTRAEKAAPEAKRTTGTFQGVEFVHLATPDRSVNVYSAYPTPDLHVRSNSRVGFHGVVEAIQGKRENGKPVARLGHTDEFAYMRTLMPRGAKEEDVFVYLSDPFIRKMVSAQVKLTERHRMVCYNHLRMIGHGSLMYHTEFGKAPLSLAELAKTNCAPGVFGTGALTCPDGGKYSLSADGTQGTCSHHGHAQFLTPCCENPVSRVNGEEADDYGGFVKDYDHYWKTYFDPIAIRIQVTPQRYRLETMILPMIDNTIYSGLVSTLGGKPEPLDALPVSEKNIFSIALRVNKEKLLKELDGVTKDLDKFDASILGLPLAEKDLSKLDYKSFRKFLDKGLGNQIGIHLHDSVPIVDFNLAALFGMGLATRGGSSQTELMGLGVAALAASLNSPLYISIPVQDAKIVDDYLAALDPLFTKRIRFGGSNNLDGFEQDFYFLKQDNEAVIRGNVLKIGPVKVRLFSGRIGNAFYIAITNKPFIMDDLLALESTRKNGKLKQADSGPIGHAMVRIRAENWNQILPDLRLGWAENNRIACLDNLAPLSNVARAVTASSGGKPGDATEVLRTADRLHGVHFFCPEGGRYNLTPDGKKCTCTVHGWNDEPRQRTAPLDDSPSAKLMRTFKGLTATLTFREEGLQAVVEIERKGAAKE